MAAGCSFLCSFARSRCHLTFQLCAVCDTFNSGGRPPTIPSLCSRQPSDSDPDSDSLPSCIFPQRACALRPFPLLAALPPASLSLSFNFSYCAPEKHNQQQAATYNKGWGAGEAACSRRGVFSNLFSQHTKPEAETLTSMHSKKMGQAVYFPIFILNKF